MSKRIYNLRLDIRNGGFNSVAAYTAEIQVDGSTHDLRDIYNILTELLLKDVIASTKENQVESENENHPPGPVS